MESIMVSLKNQIVVISVFLLGGLFSAYGQERGNYFVSINKSDSYVTMGSNGSIVDKMQMRISIDAVNQSFTKVLLMISEKGGLRLAYQKNDLPDKKFTLSNENISVLDALKELSSLDRTINIYASTSGQVVIAKKGEIIEEPYLNKVIIDGDIRGSVTDSDTGEKLLGANIFIVELQRGTTTDVEGNFEITDIEAGTYNIRISYLGYKSIFREIVVRDGQTTTLNINMEADLMGLENVVVTGVATSVKRRNLANAVESVDAEDLNRTPSQSIEQGLQGKITGANIQSNSGAPGGGMQINLRGVSSINADAQPLYVVDGVILSNAAVSGGMGNITEQSGGGNDPAQDNMVNRVADINPNDIENIEVLKGASASAIYGSRASNGVIVITTKRGTLGKPQINFSQRLGVFDLSNTIGSRKFNSEQEAVDAFGSVAADHFVQGQTYDNEAAIANRNDISTESTFSLSGGNEGTKYFISALVKDDKGIIANTGYQKQSFRANINQEISQKIDIDFTSNLVHSIASRGLSNNDNTGTSFWMVFPKTPNFFDLSANDGVFPDNPFINSNPLQTAAYLSNDENVWRFISSAQLTYNITATANSNLKMVADFGVDRFQQENEIFSPPILQYEPNDGLPGTLIKGNASNLNINSSVNLIHSFEPKSRDFIMTTSVGAQYQNRDLQVERITSQDLIAGQQKSDAATVIDVYDQRTKVIDLGLYLQEEMQLFDERMLVTVGARADQSSNAGNPDKLFFYPKASASYRFADAVPGLLDEIKFRAALGYSGNQPLYGQKFTPLSGAQNIEGNAGLTVGGIAGDPNIEPERQREIELGFDAVLFDEKANLEFTLYQQNITNLLLERELSPSQGFQTQFFNGGELQVQGVEVGLTYIPINTQDVNWQVRTSFYKNRSEIVDLPVPGFQAGGFGASLGMFRVEEGKSATSIWANEGGELTQLGDANPDFRVSLMNDLGWKQFNLYFLWDWQEGSEIINLTKLLYDLAQNSSDWNTAGQARISEFGFNTSPYIEDATFLKLREVSLTYNLEPDFLQQLWSGFRYVTLQVTGRDLLTFTEYSGLDPEVSNFGNQQIGRNVDVAPFPPSRSFWFSVDIGL
ncbi:MAG: SusC/RagA family TonB-linked outer membrane protein [Gracilimonas sp.]|uniref:SusC/RagA family TonB-linked outer membrane protein n=1 Tax=Gracilimonas sp. TaxID=1974203 RepID=UPI0037521E4E|nr:SusC/RagA family TonB-linked outer membrane protein [Gracilimonas sp.]